MTLETQVLIFTMIILHNLKASFLDILTTERNRMLQNFSLRLSKKEILTFCLYTEGYIESLIGYCAIRFENKQNFIV